LAFVPALREFFGVHARPEFGTPMHMLQLLLTRLDEGFGCALSSASAARKLFDQARGGVRGFLRRVPFHLLHTDSRVFVD
jgi:hypothetical protein